MYRADVELALSTGQPPLLPSHHVRWESHIAGCGIIRRLPKMTRARDAQGPFFGMILDAKLIGVWADLREVAKLSNLASQTSQKITAAAFNEMQVTVLYRLNFLKKRYGDGTYASMITACLLAFAFTIFLQHQNHAMKRFDRIINHLQSTLLALADTSLDLSPSFRLWMLMTLRIAVPTDVAEDWEKLLVDRALASLGIDSWSQAQRFLKDIMWIECLQDEKGERYFSSVSLRESG